MVTNPCHINVSAESILCNTRIKSYPDGGSEVLCCDRAIFRPVGWEGTGWRKPVGKPTELSEASSLARMENEGWMADDGPCRPAAAPEAVERAMRRARAQVRDMALCTPFTHFVTLTLDAARVDRYDMAAITRKLNNWCDNEVRRKGLAYVLVPERHQDGAIHFHGFFNGALGVVDSGTITMQGFKRPRKPRSAAERARWLAAGGHVVYNLPDWSLGYTTAIELYGDYSRAVSYVCKYIGKAGEKVGGRWYYSGGSLGHPEVTLCDSNIRDLETASGAYGFGVAAAGLSFILVKVRGENAGGMLSGVPSVGQLPDAQMLGLPRVPGGIFGGERGGGL